MRSYKSLAFVERAFRCIKTVDLQVRPVYHRLADRVRAHVFLCMLAYYLEWHMRQRLAPMLFDDTDKEAAEALRASVVAQAQRSPAAFSKQTTGLTADGLPVHSFRSLLADLATFARNTITTAITPNYPLTVRHQANRHPAQGVRNSSASVVASSAGLARPIVLPHQGLAHSPSGKLGLGPAAVVHEQIDWTRPQHIAVFEGNPDVKRIVFVPSKRDAATEANVSVRVRIGKAEGPDTAPEAAGVENPVLEVDLRDGEAALNQIGLDLQRARLRILQHSLHTHEATGGDAVESQPLRRWIEAGDRD